MTTEYSPIITNDTIHGTAVQIAGQGILLRGASGSGKSSVAMRLLDDCVLQGIDGLLIADDRVIIKEDQGILSVSGPESLAGLMEIRGLGIITVDYCLKSRLDLIVDLVPEGAFERYPEPDAFLTTIHDVKINRLAIMECNPDACAIIRTYMRVQIARSTSQAIEV